MTFSLKAEYRFSKYQSRSQVKESADSADSYKAVDEILHSFKVLLSKQRIILDLSAEINDEGTNALMSDYIREQEKLVWMYSAFLNKA